MFVVLFEVQPKREQWDRYLALADVTEVGAAAVVTVTETLAGEKVSLPPSSTDLLDAESYSGITITGKGLMLSAWSSDDAADAWIERQPVDARHRHIRIIRDYGMHQREEAPQYFSGGCGLRPVG